MIQRCRVAGFNFDFCLPDGHPLCLELDNYLPFSCSEAGDFRLRCFDEVRPAEGCGMSVAGTDSGVRIGLAPSPESPVLATLELNPGYSSGVLSMIPSCADFPAACKFALDTALMVQFAFYTASRGGLLLHASAVVTDGHGVAFLGKSGTGKSTHSRLWTRNIPGATLLNDDNPVVRLFPGDVLVYGSPWSGKTHCYKPVSAPLRGLVRLRQAPFNSIGRLEDVDAYLAISSSVSAFHLEGMRDLLHESVSSLVQRIPVYRLDCLPNAEAAQLCHEFFLVSLANIHPEELWPRSM